MAACGDCRDDPGGATEFGHRCAARGGRHAAPREPSLSRRRSVLRAALSRLLIGAGLVGLGGLAVGFGLFIDAIDLAERRPAHHADGIVALTGGADRIADALALLTGGHGDRLLITGVNPATSRESLARRQPQAGDAVICCVDLGYQALNTVGNARETAEWVRSHGVRSLIVVTSNYHMPRALMEIAHVLPGVDLQPFPVVADKTGSDRWWTVGQRARLLAVEYVKYLVARARVTVSPGSSDAVTVARQAP